MRNLLKNQWSRFLRTLLQLFTCIWISSVDDLRGYDIIQIGINVSQSIAWGKFDSCWYIMIMSGAKGMYMKPFFSKTGSVHVEGYMQVQSLPYSYTKKYSAVHLLNNCRGTCTRRKQWPDIINVEYFQ